MNGIKIFFTCFLYFLFITSPLVAGQLSVSTTVQANIKILSEQKSCPRCDLSGANLNRFDLSGANLEGANLSRATFFLATLTDANLKNANLKETEFGGADLAGADLSGADLTGASLAGAYMVGAKLDGEMVATQPYAEDHISDIEENVYVEDTVKPKNLPEKEEISIANRRDFEQTPPVAAVETTTAKANVEQEAALKIEEEAIVKAEPAIVPNESKAAPESKGIPSINSVSVKKEQLTVLDTKSNSQETEEKGSEQAVSSTKTTDTMEQAVTNEVTVVPPTADIDEEALEKPLMADSSLKSSTESTKNTPVVEDIADNNDHLVKDDGQNSGSLFGKKPQKIEAALVQEKNTDKEEVEKSVSRPTDATASISEDQSEVVEKVSNSNPSDVIKVEKQTIELSEMVMANIELLLDTEKCYDCDLSGADLHGKDLEAVDLEGADLSNANLSNADLEHANLKGANLSNTDLSGADLSNADLYKANLSKANLTGAKLEGALLDDANVSGVVGYQSTSFLMKAQ